MAARRIRPYRQGRLDGLCGIYARINALRLLCPNASEDACERVFRALIKARARRATSPMKVIYGGLSTRELLYLIGQWQRHTSKNLNIVFSVMRLKVPRPTLGRVWRSICRKLDDGGIALIGLDGRERHWTVAHAGTSRMLRLADSCQMRTILRSQCTLGYTRVRYRLRASEVLIIMRVSQTPTQKLRTRSKRR